MQRYDLICFDYDGTLVHSVPAITATMAVIFPEFGVEPPDQDDVRGAVGMGIRETFHRLVPGIREEDVDGWVTRYREVYPPIEQEKTELFPKAQETLRALHERGYRMAVVSNKGRRILGSSVERLGLAEYLDLVVGDRPGYARKPDPRVWEEDVAPNFPGVTPDKVLLVGDAYPDLAFAKAIGASACYATWGYGNREHCMELGPAHVIDAFPELLNILE